MGIIDDFRAFVDLRIEEGHGIREIARDTGLQASTISRVVNGAVVPDTETIDKILRLFGYRLSINKIGSPLF
jgi:DNA-binding phage protein